MGWDFLGPDDFSIIAVKIKGFHGDQIHQSLQVGLQPDRQLNGHRVMPEFVTQLLNHPSGVGAAAVAFIDEGRARNLVAFHLLIHRDGLRLNPPDRTQHQNGAIQNAQRSFHLYGEIHMPRCVDNIDLVVSPFAESCGRGDGDTALSFQLHRVHGGADAVFSLDVMDGMDAFGVVKDSFGQGGFSGIDVGADADVSDFLDISFHRVFP